MRRKRHHNNSQLFLIFIAVIFFYFFKQKCKMEEKLINCVKKHEYLYNKTLLLYRNKFKRAAAWNSISKELNLPENVCQARWKSMRDRFVKIIAESHRASGSGAEVMENQWQYKEHMEFLREHVKQRRTVTSLNFTAENCTEASPTSPLEDNLYQSMESLEDTSLFEVEYCDEPAPSTPYSTSESNSLPFEAATTSSRKKAKRECDSEAFHEFLNKMTTIAEKRFDVPSIPKESGPHDGFFAMVSEIFVDMANDAVKEAKFFFLNYLRDQVAAAKKS